MRPTSLGMIHDLDATGLLCPLPVLKARKRLQSIAVGEQLRMRADDPAAVIDVPHFCAESGHTLLESAQDGDVQVYLIEKTG
ncbi:sulfurtransferase TusA family protein [Sulfitobacter sp.]|uniref:sulfurtransferase TusA family protein n=1 Tax=Sulfitobacter sp. TaxID=1903071 RepID=UPI003EF8DDF5